MSENNENEAPKDQSTPDSALESIEQPKTLANQEILEKSLGLAKYFDNIRTHPLELIFQGKLRKKYNEALLHPLYGDQNVPDDADEGRTFLHEEYKRLEIKEKTDSIIKTSESVAKSNGFRMHVNRLTQLLPIYMMAGATGLYFLLQWIFPSAGTYLMIGMMLLVCVVPTILTKMLQGRWKKFTVLRTPEIKEIENENLVVLKTYIQEILDDIRERLLALNYDLSQINFMLYSDDYDNVKLVRIQQGTRGRLDNTVLRFEYPEGMEPKPKSTYGTSGIQEDDTNDQFILLKNAQYSYDGKLETFSQNIASDIEEKMIEQLLSISEFSNVEDKSLVLDEDVSKQIVCDCGNQVSIADLKTATSNLHNDYEFYLIVGKKCECGKNPYVLFNSPGNEKIPDGLKKLFE
ncbi:MAG: hypothetical protein ACTSVU_07440 [Promethearchaeota archaeon]